MKEFFSSAYGYVASIAGCVAVIWGLLKAIGAFKNWVQSLVKKIVERRKQQAELPQRLYKMINDIDKKFEKTYQSLDNVESKLNLVNERLNENDEATATLMLEKMMWAYNYYVIQAHQIPLDTRTALSVMYDQYKKNKKHNHVPEDFKDRIMECKVVGSI